MKNLFFLAIMAIVVVFSGTSASAEYLNINSRPVANNRTYSQSCTFFNLSQDEEVVVGYGNGSWHGDGTVDGWVQGTLKKGTPVVACGDEMFVTQCGNPIREHKITIPKPRVEVREIVREVTGLSGMNLLRAANMIERQDVHALPGEILDNRLATAGIGLAGKVIQAGAVLGAAEIIGNHQVEAARAVQPDVINVSAAANAAATSSSFSTATGGTGEGGTVIIPPPDNGGDRPDGPGGTPDPIVITDPIRDDGGGGTPAN